MLVEFCRPCMSHHCKHARAIQEYNAKNRRADNKADDLARHEKLAAENVNLRRLRMGGQGFSLGTVLFLIFLVLKLTGFIAWSWWWVTAPLWLPAAIVIGILGAIGLVAGIVLIFTAIITRIAN